MAYNIDEINGDIEYEIIGDQIIFRLKPGTIPPSSGGAITNLIKNADETVATDSNVFSALRTITEISKLINSGSSEQSNLYLKKDFAETATQPFPFPKGISIGSANLTWDELSGALKLSESVYSEKELSAYGAGGTGGAGGGPASALWELVDVSDGVFNATDGSVLQKVNGEWVARLYDFFRRGLSDSSGRIIETPEDYKLRVPKGLRYVGLSVTLRTNPTDTTYTKYEFRDGIEDYDFVPVNYFIGIDEYIEDSFTSTSKSKALSANKGRELYGMTININGGTY